MIIYAAVPDHPLGRRVLALFRQGGRQPAGAGSVLLLPEILGKPLRDGQTTESPVAGLLSRIGADRFITSNQRDFPQAITEVTVTYPGDLSDVTGTG